MAETTVQETGLLSPRRIAIQLLGFAIGIALLAWCVMKAAGAGDWERVLEASPLLIAGLVGCSLLSFFANGAIFYLVIRPVQPLRFWHMQWLNVVTSILNYAPIRAGLIARVAYHLRVDRMKLLRIGGWFVALTYTLGLTLGSCIVATVVRPQFDLVWGALVAGQLAIGGLLTWAIMGQPIVARYGRGMDAMLSHPSALWGAILLRLVDIGAFVGRMACAAAILELTLPASDIMLLGMAALALSLNPIGRTGFREIAVAFVASRLLASDLSSVELDSSMAQLALVESAGEAMAAIPCGAVALLWYRKRWIDAGKERPATDPT